MFSNRLTATLAPMTSFTSIFYITSKTSATLGPNYSVMVSSKQMSINQMVMDTILLIFQGFNAFDYIAENRLFVFVTLAIGTTVVPMILILTTIVPIRILICTTGIVNTLVKVHNYGYRLH